jgi:hypothetical protein
MSRVFSVNLCSIYVENMTPLLQYQCNKGCTCDGGADDDLMVETRPPKD